MTRTHTLKAGDHLYLIDGSGFIFRAFHALPPLSRKSDGLPVGAVQGFCNMLWKLLTDKSAATRPTHLAVIFDYSGKSFRNDFYPEYKAHRPEPPADLRPQFGLIRQATRAFNVSCVELPNYEADDLIATYTRQATDAGATVRIITSDKDLMQLVRPGVVLFDTMKDSETSDAGVFEKFGVTPDKVVDVQALAGDSVDNVPGVPGIGIKTGAELINSYGDLETLLSRAAEIKQNKRRENLIQFAEQARLSKRLVTLDENVPLKEDISTFAVDAPNATQLIGFLKALEFTTITKRIASALGADAEAIEPSSVEIKFWPPEDGTAPAGTDAPAPSQARSTPIPAETRPGPEPEAEPAEDHVASVEARLRAIPVTHADYETVTSLARLEAWIAEATEQGSVSVDT